MLVYNEELGRHTIVGTTLDDSVGEAFDKTARLLGISSIPGGPELAKMGDAGEVDKAMFSMPMSKSKKQLHSCNFSFAGLKTQARTLVEKFNVKLEKQAISEEQRSQ